MLAQIRQYVTNGGAWWETAGYSFYNAYYLKDGRWQQEAVGPAGLNTFGVPVWSGEVEQPAEKLSVPQEARAWLGEALCADIEKAASSVNRALPRSTNDPDHFTLVAGADNDYIGGYRLGGWGWLWRIGGGNPNPQVALPAAVAALEYLYTHAPATLRTDKTKYLWHATITAE
jgi:hypothetical protein